MRTYLFEDEAESLEPLTLTRPVFELRCGLATLAAKQARHFATGPGERRGVSPTCDVASAAAVFLRPHLAEIYRQENAGISVNEPAHSSTDSMVLVNGRWLPATQPASAPTSPYLGLVDDEIAYVVLGPEQSQGLAPDNLSERLEAWRKSLPCCAAGGRLVCFPWDLVEHNAEQICADFACRFALAPCLPEPPLAIVGPKDRCWLSPTAHVDPMVVADTRHGPVVIDDHAVVTAFTRLEGPCHIGPHTHVLGARIRAGTTLGPGCRIGGEVEASIIHGHSNKYHDGFLGHAYVGEWVNLGAGTCNSDLRNDYGPVQVAVNGRPTSTGLTKVGCYIGDHSKTGLGTLINTGTNVGIFCNLLPAGPLVPKLLPSFTTWWNGNLRESAEWARLLTTAREVMRRRARKLSDAHVALYLHVFDETALSRRRALHDAEQRRLRRSAG